VLNHKLLRTCQHVTEAHVNFLDDRITTDQLRAKVCETTSPQQQNWLYGVPFKYQQHLTKRPGRCNAFEYEFKLEGDMPPTANSRPIPFALRPPVREQIQEMLRDRILEESHSACQPTYTCTPWTQTYSYRHLYGHWKVLGDDVVNDHVITYVDDLLIHSSSLWKFGENNPCLMLLRGWHRNLCMSLKDHI